MNDIIDMIVKARESYKLPPQKFLITQRERDWLMSCWPKGNDKFEEFMEEHYAVVMPLEALDTHVNKQLRYTFQELQGDIARARGWRVATDKKVSGVRSLGHTPSSVYFDEPYYTADADWTWANGPTPSRQLEHPMLRGRDVGPRLSRIAYWWRSSLSKAILAGHPRIKVEL